MSITNKNLGYNDKKGFFFSLDLTAALFTMLVMLNIALLHFNESALLLVEEAKKFELQKNALLLADSMVKNSNSEQSLLGSAVFDSEKHRVLANNVQKEELLKTKPVSFGNWKTTVLLVKEKSGKEEVLFAEENSGKNCAAVERFVFVDSKKAILRVVVCEK